MLYYLDSHECILNEANSLTNSLSDSECSDQVNYYENQCDNNSTSSESSCIKAIIDQQLVAGIGAKLIQVDNLTDCQQKCIEAEIVHSDGFR